MTHEVVEVSNEWEDQKVEEILSMSDWELVSLVDTALLKTDIEIAYELPIKIREALQTIAYDILVQQNHILNSSSIKTFNDRSEVEILRKRWYANNKD